MSRRILQHAAPIDDALADNTLAVLEYPRAIASVKSTRWKSKEGPGGTLSSAAPKEHATCSRSTSRTCNWRWPSRATNIKKGYQEIRFGEYPRYVGDMADLARMIRGEKEPDFSYDHDLAVLETMLTAAKMPLDR